MTLEPSGIDHPRADTALAETSLPATEVEYALILSQMIDVAEQDPSQLRLAIYEFARTKLIYNTMNAPPGDRERLSLSLEAAIAGVEKFSRRRKGNRRIAFHNGRVEVPASSRAEATSSLQALPHHSADAYLTDRRATRRRWTDAWRVNLKGAWVRKTQPDWFTTALFLFVFIAGLILLMQRGSLWRNDKSVQPAIASSVAKDPGAPAPDAAVASSSTTAIPLPKDYGVYVVNGSTLTPLQPLVDQIPDKRIEMSAPINQASNTVIPDGAARFVIYRRDFSSDAPDQIDVRAVARVERVIKFDAKGKPIFSSAEPTWIIRNVIYDFKVRPIADHAEMFLVQPKDVELPSGRYVVVLKNRGYDFSVAGAVEDPAQCVERTDAMNGSFYSDCQR